MVALIDKAGFIKRMKELLSDVGKFKEIIGEPGKEINLLVQHEGNLIEFFKQVKSSFKTNLLHLFHSISSGSSTRYLCTGYLKFANL